MTNTASKKKKGFGIIEVLIGGMVIVSVLVAIVGIGKMSLRAAENNRMRIKATYIAQDGIEKLRKLRDSNWIDGDSGTQWDAASDGAEITSQAEFVTNGIVQYYFNGNVFTKGATKEPVSTDDQAEFSFKRYFVIEKVGGLIPSMADEVKNKDSILAKVIVEWPSGSSTEKIELREILTDWRANY